MSNYTPKPSGCDGCPARDWGVGFVPPELPRQRRSSRQTETGEGPTLPGGGVGSNVHVAFVGQGPGETEARTSIPFHPNAPSGDLLTRWMHSAGLQRSEVLVTNVVWCWLPKTKHNGVPMGNTDPKDGAIAHCLGAHLRPLLEEYGFVDDQPDDRKVIVTVGAPASRTFLGDPKVERHLGTMVRREV